MEAVKNYTTHVDAKKRITLRGAKFSYYNVKEYGNGCMLLEPMELVAPLEISENTLRAMDKAIENFKMGVVSEPINLSEFGA